MRAPRPTIHLPSPMNAPISCRITAILLLSACTSDSPSGSGSDPTPDEIRLSETQATLPDAGAVTLTATAYAAGRVVSPSSPIAWRSSDSTVARVAGGTVTGTRPGEAQITAELGAIRATASITVVAVPQAITRVSGDAQAAPVGGALGQPLVIRVTDRHGSGVGGVAVAFSVAGGGSVTRANVVTNTTGHAQAVWTLGITSGAQAVQASSGTLVGSPVAFTATATSGPIESLEAVSGTMQSGAAGVLLGTPIVVRARDVHGNPVPAVPVRWSVAVGGGTLQGTQALTDSAGRAETRWTLGAVPGANRLSVEAGTASVEFTATGHAGPAATASSPVDVEPTSARLTGTATANGLPTTAWVEWSTASSFQTSSASSELGIGEGFAPVAVQAQPVNLTPGTQYWFRVAASNAAGTQRSAAQTFTTPAALLPAPTPQSPTGGAVGVSLSPTFSWTAVPGATSYRLMVATDSAAIPQDPEVSTCEGCVLNVTPTGTSYTAAADALAHATMYYWRVRGRSGTQSGHWSSARIFTTAAQPPTVSTSAASSVSESGATLRGTVHPHGQATEVWFDWGTNADLSGAASTSRAPAGSGNSVTNAQAVLGSLQPGRQYYFRIAASSAAGTQRGNIQTFTTPVACGRLDPGALLTSGRSVRSCNGAINLVMQTDGNVVLYDSAGASWVAPGTVNQGTNQLVMQTDGNLVAYANGTPRWASGTGVAGSRLAVQDDCNLVVYSPAGQALWSSNTFCRAPLPPAGRMQPGHRLSRGLSVSSSSGTATLEVRQDGSVILTGSIGTLWAAPNPNNRHTRHLVMQGDGNLVAYDDVGQVVWATGTQGHAGAWLAIQDDCRLVIFSGPYPTGGTVLWSSPSRCDRTASVRFTWPTDPENSSQGFFSGSGTNTWYCLNTGCSGWFDIQPFQRYLYSSYGWHLGSDWNLRGADDLNKPVYAVADGHVERAFDQGGSWGKLIFIRHDTPEGVFTSMYAHVNWLPTGPPTGVVRRGQPIALVGTANGQWPSHLHFEIRDGVGTTPGPGYTTNQLAPGARGPQGQRDPNMFIRDRL